VFTLVERAHADKSRLKIISIYSIQNGWSLSTAPHAGIDYIPMKKDIIHVTAFFLPPHRVDGKNLLLGTTVYPDLGIF
jgi:hypothetical protein